MALRSDVEDCSDHELVQWALEIEDGLTPWEVEFVESLSRWMEDADALTPRQREKLDDIVEAKG